MDSYEPTDASCPQCRRFQPVMWTQIKIAEVNGSQIGRFEGYEMSCRICQFVIAKIGRVLNPLSIGKAR